jgi:hypothetical protein
MGRAGRTGVQVVREVALLHLREAEGDARHGRVCRKVGLDVKEGQGRLRYATCNEQDVTCSHWHGSRPNTSPPPLPITPAMNAALHMHESSRKGPEPNTSHIPLASSASSHPAAHCTVIERFCRSVFSNSRPRVVQLAGIGVLGAETLSSGPSCRLSAAACRLGKSTAVHSNSSSLVARKSWCKPTNDSGAAANANCGQRTNRTEAIGGNMNRSRMCVANGRTSSQGFVFKCVV